MADWVNGDLDGLPPLLLEAGEKEMFRDHAGMFAEKARAAGVSAVDRVWPGMPHVFQLFSFIPSSSILASNSPTPASKSFSIPA